MALFYRNKPFNENGKSIRGYRQRMFREWRNRGIEEGLSPLSKVYVTRQEPSERTVGFQNLSWK